MTLSNLLLLQCFYATLGIGYNAVSYWQAASGRQLLAPTPPLTGAMSMLVFGLFLIPGFLRLLVAYRILMAAAVILLGYGGVVKHVVNAFGGLSAYSSTAAWALALGINVSGLLLNLYAAGGMFSLG